MDDLARLDERIIHVEKSLLTWLRQDRATTVISAIPGVGLLTATAAVATMGQPGMFRSGREFAAWIGLIPGQTGSGGRVRLLGMSKRGDTYLRTLLIHRARSVLRHAKTPGAWLQQLIQRRPPNVVIVALANKIARTIWAVLAHDRVYDKDYISTRPHRTALAQRFNLGNDNVSPVALGIESDDRQVRPGSTKPELLPVLPSPYSE